MVHEQEDRRRVSLRTIELRAQPLDAAGIEVARGWAPLIGVAQHRVEQDEAAGRGVVRPLHKTVFVYRHFRERSAKTAPVIVVAY